MKSEIVGGLYTLYFMFNCIYFNKILNFWFVFLQEQNNYVQKGLLNLKNPT